MIEGLTSKQWAKVNGWIVKLIDEDHFKPAPSREIGVHAFQLALSKTATSGVHVSRDLIAEGERLASYHRACRRERLHRERAARLRRRVVTARP